MAADKIAAYQPAMTVGALLGGFAFTAALTLLTTRTGTVAAVMITSFLISTSAFIVAAVATWFLIAQVASDPNTPKADFFVAFAAIGLMAGVTAFAVGLAASGFLYATWLGSVSIACAIAVLGSFGVIAVKTTQK